MANGDPTSGAASGLAALLEAAVAAQALSKSEAHLVFDAAFPDSRPAPHQWAFFSDVARYQYRFIRGGNQSSKSATTTKEMAWAFTDTHPRWTRPTSTRCPHCDARPVFIGEGPNQPDYRCARGHSYRDWGDGPLLGIVAGQSKLSMEEELWASKMRPFFPAEWKERYRGSQLSSVRNTKTGDRIVFLSHADSSPKNIKYLQTFVANWVLLDEMPTSVAVFEELARRTDSRAAPFTGGFTPKVYSGAVKRWVDALAPPLGQVYRFSKFQNPLFAGKEVEERAKLKGLPEHTVRCVLFGDWMPGEGMVFWFEPTLHGAKRHPQYSPRWPHVLVVDPATESKMGFFVAYQVPPGTLVLPGHAPPGAWVVKDAYYIEGTRAAHKFVYDVEERVKDLNVVARVSDPAATWYIRTAADLPDGRKFEYQGVPYKNTPGRKDELLVEGQEALGKSVWVEDGEGAETAFFIDELGSMHRSPDTNLVVKPKKFHLIDCFVYFVDSLPFNLPKVQCTDLVQQQLLYAQYKQEGGEAPESIASVVTAVAKLDAFRVHVGGAFSRRRHPLYLR